MTRADEIRGRFIDSLFELRRIYHANGAIDPAGLAVIKHMASLFEEALGLKLDIPVKTKHN
jgi:hypothetical protein